MIGYKLPSSGKKQYDLVLCAADFYFNWQLMCVIWNAVDREKMITCLCEVEKRGLCWGLGRSVWPEAGAMQGRTGPGQAGNSGGIALGQAHSLEAKPDLCLPAIVKEKNSPAL